MRYRTEKQCSKCKEEKLLAEFSTSGKNEAGYPRYKSQCRPCMAATNEASRQRHLARDLEKKRQWRERHPDYMKQWAWDHPGYARAKNLRDNYSMTVEEWESLFESQGRKCAACGAKEHGGRNWHTDHDHSCCDGGTSCGNCTRGILCSSCNLALGHLKDDPIRVLALYDYLDSRGNPNLQAGISRMRAI